MGDDAIAAPRKVMLHHDNDGNTSNVTEGNGTQWGDVGPVPPDWDPPGQILRKHVFRLVKTQQNPTCWYLIVAGRAWKICQ